MRTHVERMKQEHKELKTKLTDLNAFIYSNDLFKKLDDREQVRMIKQSGFMESYLTVLDQRIWVCVDDK